MPFLGGDLHNLTIFALHVKLQCSMKLISSFLLFFALAVQQSAPVIHAPAAGQTLQGKVDISGTADAPNFASAELAFAYVSGPADNWFTIQTFAQPVLDAALASWDTSLISDGDYNLRLRVTSLDGSFQDVIVADLHVRNYTTVTPASAAMTETSTALPTLPSAEAALTEAPTQTPHPTPTQLPPNPASLTAAEIYASVWRGAFVIAFLFIAFGLLTRLRRS